MAQRLGTRQLAQIGRAEDAFSEPVGCTKGERGGVSCRVRVWLLDEGGECIGRPIDCGPFELVATSERASKLLSPEGAELGVLVERPGRYDDFERGLAALALSQRLGARAAAPRSLEFADVSLAARSAAERSWASSPAGPDPVARRILYSSAWFSDEERGAALSALAGEVDGRMAPGESFVWRDGAGRPRLGQSLESAFPPSAAAAGLVVSDAMGALEVSCGGREYEVRVAEPGADGPGAAWEASRRARAAERLDGPERCAEAIDPPRQEVRDGPDLGREER